MTVYGDYQHSIKIFTFTNYFLLQATISSMNLLITNIKGLVHVEKTVTKNKVSGQHMANLMVVENAFLLIEKGKITALGSMIDCPPINPNTSTINAIGRYVFPTWCDSHTHIVYAASREQEFVARIKGNSYEEIAQQGGGILNSAKKLQQTTEAELLTTAFQRLEEMKCFGTGAIEIKSGYGLTVESELKMLRVIQQLKELTPLTIKATFLAAHAMPTIYKNDRQQYIDLIIKDMLPIVSQEKLADYMDVFCDKGFFTVEETDQLLEAGYKFGLQPKIHANELACSGGVQVGVKHKALSVDHLERITQVEIDCLLNSETMPTILPGTSFFLNIPYAPARKMIDAGLPVALATDYNPGSNPSGNMPFILSLACLKMGMLPTEAIHAATSNGAYAMGVEKELGSIAIGKQGNVFITKPMSSIDFLPYAFGSNWIEQVIIGGKQVV